MVEVFCTAREASLKKLFRWCLIGLGLIALTCSWSIWYGVGKYDVFGALVLICIVLIVIIAVMYWVWTMKRNIVWEAAWTHHEASNDQHVLQTKVAEGKKLNNVIPIRKHK